MKVYDSVDALSLQASWVAIGNFDGMHVGHQALINQLVQGAKAAGLPSVVITFDPDPIVYFEKRYSKEYYLIDLPEKKQLFSLAGIDHVIVIPFTLKFSQKSAFEFLDHLKTQTGFTHLLHSKDFALGRNRASRLDEITRISTELEFTLDAIPPVEIDGETVSSSAIRSLLLEGNVEKAACFLGRPYEMTGQIVHGSERGRRIGLPTANMLPAEGKMVPKNGVYACLACVDAEVHQAVTNVGVRPTFEQAAAKNMETLLLEFSGDIYGKTMCLQFISRLRDEEKFPNVQALIDQVEVDKKHAAEILTHA